MWATARFGALETGGREENRTPYPPDAFLEAVRKAGESEDIA